MFKAIRNTFSSVLVLLLVSTASFAQKGVEDGSRYGRGEDSINCIRNLSLYREYVKHGNYVDALPPWRVVFAECPRATKNIYIDGIKIFKSKLSKEKDPALFTAYVDTLMLIYDQRISYYRQEGSVLARKGVDLIRYQRNDIDKLEEGYGYLKRSLELQKNKSSVAAVATFMQAAYGLFEKERLTDMQVIADYAMVSDIIDYMLERNPDDANANKVKEAVDFGFITSGAPTCQSLTEYFEPSYEDKKTSEDYLRKVVTFLFTLSCKETPLYAKAAVDLYSIAPNARSAFNLAKLFMTKEDYNQAMKYYLEAIDKEDDKDKMADYYYQLGVITNSKLSQHQKAREYALKAIELRPSWGDPYILIGDAYAASKECFDDDFEKTTVYWVAVDKFSKAKSLDPEVSEKAEERIKTYSQYFPDVETVFFYGLQEGDTYTVGCWINETTQVRTK